MPKALKASYTKNPGQKMAFKIPKTPIQKLVAWEM